MFIHPQREAEEHELKKETETQGVKLDEEPLKVASKEPETLKDKLIKKREEELNEEFIDTKSDTDTAPKAEAALDEKDRFEFNTYVDHIANEEKFRADPYKATKDEKDYTIGYGHYGDDVKQDQPSITKDQAKIILKEDIKSRLTEINNALPKFNDYSLNLKKHLLSSWFRGSLVQSPLTRKLINQGKFKEAADEFLNNDEYRNAKANKRSGIIKRMEATAKALRNESN